jgi:hypothetical protein
MTQRETDRLSRLGLGHLADSNDALNVELSRRVDQFEDERAAWDALYAVYEKMTEEDPAGTDQHWQFVQDVFQRYMERRSR